MKLKFGEARKITLCGKKRFNNEFVWPGEEYNEYLELTCFEIFHQCENFPKLKCTSMEEMEVSAQVARSRTSARRFPYKKISTRKTRHNILNFLRLRKPVGREIFSFSIPKVGLCLEGFQWSNEAETFTINYNIQICPKNWKNMWVFWFGQTTHWYKSYSQATELVFENPSQRGVLGLETTFVVILSSVGKYNNNIFCWSYSTKCCI